MTHPWACLVLSLVSAGWFTHPTPARAIEGGALAALGSGVRGGVFLENLRSPERFSVRWLHDEQPFLHADALLTVPGLRSLSPLIIGGATDDLAQGRRALHLGLGLEGRWASTSPRWPGRGTFCSLTGLTVLTL